MIERGEHARLALEARQPIGVAGEAPRQDLDRDVAAELRVARAIDLAHAADADARAAPGRRRGAGRSALRRRSRCPSAPRWPRPILEKAPIDACWASSNSTSRRSATSPAHACPRKATRSLSLRDSAACSISSTCRQRSGVVGQAFFNARRSQSFAIVQSRLTVRTDTPRASAVSSMLRPPK